MGHYVIIGGGGYLGANVIRALQKNGYQERIIVVDPTPMEFPTVQFSRQLVDVVEKSFLDPQVLQEVLQGAETVIHLAAVGHMGMVACDRKFVFEFNVNGTIKLVEACKRHGVSRFLYASSVAVAFVGVPLLNASEDDPLPNPKLYLDYYSASKAEAEKYVLSQSTPTFKTVALRFRGIYGAEDPNVTRKVADLIRKRLFLARVSIHDRESNSMASSAANCAKAFALADHMLKKTDGIHAQSYYIMDQEITGQYEFWTPLVHALGRTPPSIFLKNYKVAKAVVYVQQLFCYHVLGFAPILTMFELAILAMDNTYSIEKARRELGYEPEPNSMAEVAAHYRMLATREMSKWNWIIGTISIAAFAMIVISLMSFF
ncbi:Protein CBG14581 [Caenorhabditis briggsae]|uniref:3-beta hydroxysteroid dehydrogenase/isomerase domain-containing protein n=2 Tax=Caenorhabditis briggsae TaxID=6238 RepID=A0AAE9CUM5_CAEBR|nr:Protein CBG14581 [Caenorhabditis briggsae]ULT82284.1 hypothetical protein L3Y34_011920 [Caenorhabditis briggsae]CAP33061.2 Protein CBG14581 [Caenorhabditis briggsae]